MPNVLITGANRGIGIEFVRQYADGGWNVIATCREPGTAANLQELARRSDRVRVEVLDLASPASIDALALRLGNAALDVLLHNAAFLGPGGPQSLGQWTGAPFLEAFQASRRWAPRC